MKLQYLVQTALTLALFTALSASAVAEGKAFCDVRKKGEKAKKATGHCDYSEQGDYITIKLANDEQYKLTKKKDKKNAFKDQNGNGVHREKKNNGTHYYKWEHKNITVYPEGN